MTASSGRSPPVAQADVMVDSVPRCRVCAGVVKPDIVFFGEPLPPRFLLHLADFPVADLLLILGTSLEVCQQASGARARGGEAGRPGQSRRGWWDTGACLVRGVDSLCEEGLSWAQGGAAWAGGRGRGRPLRFGGDPFSMSGQGRGRCEADEGLPGCITQTEFVWKQ